VIFARKHWAGLVAVVLIALSVVLGLLAVDVRAVRTTVARDDLRFRALPTHRSLWRLHALLPADAAARLVGSSDTMAYRRAVQLFWYSRIGTNPEVRQDLPTIRAEAQQQLQQEMDSGWTTQERSAAANLLGVLVVTTPTPSSDQAVIAQILKRAAGYFQRSIAIDPGNFDAKQNLELVLRVTRPGKGGLNRDARAGYGFGRGRATVPGGSGY
jgi:hypothetical protein